MPGDEVVVSQDRLFMLAMLKKLAAPFSILALIGAATVSSAGCSSSTPTGSGGSGGTGGAATTTGTGGCAQASECPGTDTDCSKRICTAGVCGTKLIAAGTAVPSQTDSDCKASVCDGMGMTTSQNDDQDVLDDGNACTVDVCVDGTPKNNPTPSGAVCADGTGKVCDGKSKCVECVDGAGCTSGVCDKNNCVAASCTDKVKNVNETDVDCGGADCNPCATGKVCVAGTDCVDTICTGGLCAAPTCLDAAKNGAETDVDCGGATCGGCGPDLGCAVDGDCVGGKCSGTKCLPTCSDKVKNTTETDVDCGGPTCGGCDDAKTCAVGTDCKSKICTAGLCAVPSCTDQQQNGTESDVDCGGSCPACNATQMCTKGADCVTGVCTGNVCQGAVCNDSVKNGTETDVDCGGNCATKCATNKICIVAGDCASGVCTGGLCKAPICGDGVVNAAEVCDDGNPVSGDGCSSACATEGGFTCAGMPSTCTANCGDGLRLGAETCDDGNTTAGDGCSATCTVQSGYTCNTASPNVCTTICGDGIKAGAEACDDGNVVAGDGCSATCTVQAGFTCAGTTPTVCAAICGDNLKLGIETCDDGNVVNGDCCSSTCQIEAGCEVEANNTIATANNFSALQIGNKVNGFIKPAGELDYYAFTVPAGQTGAFTASLIDNFLGVTCASANIDSFFTLFDAAGVMIGKNDDINGAANRCSTLTFTGLVPATYYLEVKAFSSSATFAYTLQSTTTLVTCGNNALEAGEQCDDGNLVNGDGCSSTCKTQVQETEPNATCATANGPLALGAVGTSRIVAGTLAPTSADIDWFSFTVANYTDLKLETFDISGPGTCSLGVDTQIQVFKPDCVTSLAGPQDQGGINNCSKLDPASSVPMQHLAPGTYNVKVTGFTNSFYYTMQATVVALCGNGVKEGSEQCDGGPTCGVDCTLIPVCGDGVKSGAETCDDGNLVNGDGCTSTCTVQTGFTCNAASPSVCTAICGDGLKLGAEACDDGNTANLDGCTSTCTVQAGFTCVGAPSVCTASCGDGIIAGGEVCDDGNVVNGDGCDSTCHIEGGANETEPNNTQAQADANPVITGDSQFLASIGVSGDKDIYKVTVATGTVMRFETFENTTLDCPTIALTMRLFDSTFVQKKIDVSGSVVASGINNCAAIITYLPAGSYYVQVEKTAAGTVPKYVFQTKVSTSVGSEIEPNGTSATATPMPGADMDITGTHTSGDLDWYAITIPSNGLSVRAETIEDAADVFNSSKNCESLATDTILTLFSPLAVSLVSDNDDGRGFCSAIDGTGATPRDAAAHNLAAGTYYLQVSNGSSTHTYKLAVTIR